MRSVVSPRRDLSCSRIRSSQLVERTDCCRWIWRVADFPTGDSWMKPISQGFQELASTYDAIVFGEHQIVIAQSTDKDHCIHTFETMNPFLSFTSLPAHIDNPGAERDERFRPRSTELHYRNRCFFKVNVLSTMPVVFTRVRRTSCCVGM